MISCDALIVGKTNGAAATIKMTLWRPLPHFDGPSLSIDRRNLLASGAGIASSVWMPSNNKINKNRNWVASAAEGSSPDSSSPLSETSSTTTTPSVLTPRSVYTVQSHGAIPVWPSWGGGRVVPMSLMSGDSDGGAIDAAVMHDPFILLAHHDHWFDPRDPLREPFKKFGQLTGLPYIDVEGFKMHPHRGFDIWTYILDGSDGFLHRDSLGATTKLYKGGTTQFMRTGSGVLHEEFWETSSTRRTNIELYQLWVNLPASHKMDPPSIHYIGHNTEQPWIEQEIIANDNKVIGSVRNLGDTLNQAIMGSTNDNGDSSSSTVGTTTRLRPPIQIYHVKLVGSTKRDGSHRWTLSIPPSHSALLYVRKGSINLPNYIGSGGGNNDSTVQVKEQQTATWTKHSGNCIELQTTSTPFDGLLLTGEPLQEPIATAGPIVMNTQQELRQAYQQLSDGTFLDREYALKQHKKLS